MKEGRSHWANSIHFKQSVSLSCRSATALNRKKRVYDEGNEDKCFILLAGLVLLAWITPLGPMPGIFIGGTPSELPESWGSTADIHEIKLEVQGSLPRVVIIWVVQVDGSLHIVGSNSSGWVQMLGDGGSVRMRMGDKTYSLAASLLTTNWEPVLEAYGNKYRMDYPDIVGGFPAMEEAALTTAVFRLTGG